MLLTKEQILAQRLPTERCTIPWVDGGSEIIVRGLPSRVLTQFYQSNEKGEDGSALLFANAVIDENGKRVFADTDAPSLENLDHSILAFVVAKAIALSAIPENQMTVIRAAWKKVGVEPIDDTQSSGTNG